jgi:hypothetical protein
MREYLQKQTAACESLEVELSLSISESAALDAKDSVLAVLRTYQSGLRKQLKTLKVNIARSQELLLLVVQDPLFTTPLTSSP